MNCRRNVRHKETFSFIATYITVWQQPLESDFSLWSLSIIQMSYNTNNKTQS